VRSGLPQGSYRSADLHPSPETVACEKFGSDARNDAGRELFPYLTSKNEIRQCDDIEELSHLLEFLANASFPKPTGERIAIIGSGPAGLAAGHDLALMGFRPTIFEMEPQPAGMLYTGVPDIACLGN